MARRIAQLDRFRACRQANSAVEFALVLPIFVAMLFGILIYGSYFALTHSLQQLAAEAARRSVAGISDTERTSLAVDYIKKAATSYFMVDPHQLSVDAAASPSDSNNFIVTLRYDASDSFFNFLPHIVPAPSPNIVRTAVIPRGGY